MDPVAYTADEAADDALAVLDAAGVERAVVIGPCSGAGMAIKLAADHAERVIAAVAINPGLPVTQPHPIASGTTSRPSEDCVDWALNTTAETIIADHGAPANLDATSLADMCRRVRCPVLVINGDQDQCQPPERSRIVAELTGGQLLVIEGAGHLPNACDP